MKREYLMVEGKFELLKESEYLDDGLNELRWRRSFLTDDFSDKVHKFISNIGKLQKIGNDAESIYLLVDLDKKANDNEYETIKRNVAIAVETINSKGAQGTFYNGQGDPVKGLFNVQNGIFTTK